MRSGFGAARPHGRTAQAIGNRAPPRAAGERLDEDEIGADGVERAQAGVQALGVGGGFGRQAAPGQAGVARVGSGVGEHGDTAAFAGECGGFVDEQRRFGDRILVGLLWVLALVVAGAAALAGAPWAALGAGAAGFAAALTMVWRTDASGAATRLTAAAAAPGSVSLLVAFGLRMIGT